MIMTSLFADQEREAKLNKLGDALQVMEQHVDFAALAAEVDLAAPRPTRERGGRPPYPTELMVRVLLIQQLLVMHCRCWTSMSTSPPLLRRSTLRHRVPAASAAAVRLSPPN